MIIIDIRVFLDTNCRDTTCKTGFRRFVWDRSLLYQVAIGRDRLYPHFTHVFHLSFTECVSNVVNFNFD